MKPYKYQIIQKLQVEDIDRRQQLASSYIGRSEMNPNFLEEVLLSDEELSAA